MMNAEITTEAKVQDPGVDAAWRLQNGWSVGDDVQIARAVLARYGDVKRRLCDAGWDGETRPPDIVIGRALQTALGQQVQNSAATTKPLSLRARRLDLGMMMATPGSFTFASASSQMPVPTPQSALVT